MIFLILVTLMLFYLTIEVVLDYFLYLYIDNYINSKLQSKNFKYVK